MKKLVLKSIMLILVATAAAFGFDIMLAAVMNHFYWNVPSSIIYGLDLHQYYSLVGYVVIGMFVSAYTWSAMIISKWNKLRKEA